MVVKCPKESCDKEMTLERYVEETDCEIWKCSSCGYWVRKLGENSNWITDHT